MSRSRVTAAAAVAALAVALSAGSASVAVASSGTATNAATTGAPDAARPVDPAEAIPVLRERIDELDAQIARLVQSRAEISHRIQAARVQGGGTRIELGREGSRMEASSLVRQHDMLTYVGVDVRSIRLRQST